MKLDTSVALGRRAARTITYQPGLLPGGDVPDADAPGGRGRSALRTSHRALPALTATLLMVGGPGGLEAYRFYGPAGGGAIVTAAEARRWHSADFPLRFHLQDNIPDFLDEPRWRDFVRDGLREWSALGTADIPISITPDLVEGDGADGNDGRLTIGWVPFEDEADTVSGRARWWSRVSTNRIVHCDIEMNAARFRGWLDEGVEREWVERAIRNTLVHEVGHCLGLAHTEPHPIPGWLTYLDKPPPIPPGFLPETVMSYGFGRDAAVTEDERTAVSLLYPASGFAASRGAVAGRLIGESGGAPFAYVQAVYLGYSPRMGPGAFADGEGYFHLEGLEPGTVLLWVHPILIHYSNGHGELLVMAAEGGGLDVLDQWHWVGVTAGQTVGVPDLVLAAGRLP